MTIHVSNKSIVDKWSGVKQIPLPYRGQEPARSVLMALYGPPMPGKYDRSPFFWDNPPTPLERDLVARFGLKTSRQRQ